MSSVQNFTVGKFKEPLKDSDYYSGFRSVKTVENYKVPMDCRSLSVRKRSERVLGCCKKGRDGKFSNVFVNFDDEESGSEVRFKGFYEEEVVPSAVSEKMEVVRKVDEDCETGDDEIEYSVMFLSGQLEEAVLNNFDL